MGAKPAAGLSVRPASAGGEAGPRERTEWAMRAPTQPEELPAPSGWPDAAAGRGLTGEPTDCREAVAALPQSRQALGTALSCPRQCFMGGHTCP